jgi:hypothetical protein
MDIQTSIANVPPPKRRPHIRRSAELEEGIIFLATRGFPMTSIVGVLGISSGNTVKQWARRDPVFGARFDAAVEAGRQLNSAVVQAKFLAGERALRALLPSR